MLKIKKAIFLCLCELRYEDSYRYLNVLGKLQIDQTCLVVLYEVSRSILKKKNYRVKSKDEFYSFSI